MASSRPSSPASGPQSRGSRSRSVTPTHAATTRPRSNNPFFTFDNSSSDDDAAEILRPRGKLASRMQVRGGEEEESESALELDANSTRASPSREDAEMEGDDEDVVTTRPRKLVSRRERSSTPEMGSRPQEPASPGLFVSPSKPQSPATNQGDADDVASPPAVTKNHRFQAMLARKREERLAREAEEARKKAARLEAAGYTNDADDDLLAEDDGDERITDDEGGRKLTQEAAAARPPRKASKKALEEMHRETQRLTRGLQLAHEAKVKKKITKASLFERFNFKPAGAAAAPVEKVVPAASSSRAATPESAGQSDAEKNSVGTPPSSPPTDGKEGEAESVAQPAATETTNPAAAENDDDFPTLEEMVARKQLDKGKGNATAADLEEAPKQAPRPKRVILPANIVTLDSDSDDDLHIIPSPKSKSKIDAIFARIPVNQAKEPLPLQRLRRLAHLDDPDKRPAPPSRPGSKVKKQVQEPVMTAAELHVNLLQRARRQAKLERDRNLEELRAKGVHVQTAEERARERRDVEDIVAKARQEAEEIMQREREDAKAERRRKREAGEEDPLGWDDSEDDEEYREEVEEEAEIELSGSEEEEEEGEADPAGELIDDAAESAEESETEEAEGEAPAAESDEEMLPSSKQARRRPRKQVTIVSDDEDDAAPPIVKATPRPKAHFAKSPSVSHARSPSVPTSVLRSATKTFIPGLPVAGPAGLGLTQIFAGTMDDSQLGSAPAGSPSQPRPTFDVTAFPDSNFSQTAQSTRDDDDNLILDSQPARETQPAPETQGVQLRFSQSQVHGFDTFLAEADAESMTQMSELLEPTQDGGFQNFSPLRQRFVELPASTKDTVPAGGQTTQADEQNDSPLVRRTGKLRRRGEVAASPSRRRVGEEEERGEEPEADEFGFGTVPASKNNAFAAMKEAAVKERKRKEAEAFDKKKSRARGMVEEQAEESEDEYAGLGGADGEDSSDDDDHSVKEMIDDETKDDAGDERKLAAFYADRERAADEKQVDKLFHDLTTGQLRRKRNGNWDDLSDDDDGGERRRRMKRQQFAKMQRTLFADERISKVAENPRNQAFLRTIEDHGSDEEMDFLFAPMPAVVPESQASQASASGTVIPNSQPQAAAAPTLPNPRRTRTGKKPSNLSEIRESLSTLLDEPYHGASVIPATDPASSDGEDEADNDNTLSKPAAGLPNSNSSDKENLPRNHANPRRTHRTNTVIDRISLKRQPSSTTSTTHNAAFSTTTTAGSSGSGSFKVPALLRRATTNSLISTTTSSSSSTTNSTSRTGGGGGGGGGAGSGGITKIKKPAGKRSGVSYLARETERRAAVAEKERRREERKVKGAEGRGRVVGGLFGGGKFE